MSRQLWNTSKDRGSTTSLNNLFQPVLSHTHSKNKCCLMFRGDFPYFSLRSLSMVLSLGTTKKAWLHLLYPLHHTVIHIDKIPVTCLLKTPTCLSISSLERCSSPFTISMAILWTLSSMSMSFLYWAPRTGDNTLGVASLVLNRVMISCIF